MRRRVPRLPSEYQEVEYIESSGTQYIDSWWTPSSNYARVVTQIEPTLSGQQWEVFYGMTNWSNHYSLHTNKDTLKWYINVWSNGNIITDIAFSSWTKVNTEFEANNWAYSVNVNSTTYSWTYSWTVVQSTRNMYIFAYNENGSITWKPSMKLYSFKVYSATSTLVRDFVPCYRKSDSVIWLYDLVNDQFYTNAWSGTFTKGTDSSTIELKEFQVWPDEQWQLRDETDMANSTTWSSWVIASTNWKFIRPSYSFGWGNGAYSKWTIDWYDVLVASSQHWNVHIWLSDANYTDLMSHKKVKIVWDYFNLWANQSNYTNWIWFWWNESLTDTSSSSTITVWSNWSGMSFSYNTWYSMEQIINTSDMSCTATITNLSNQAKSTFTYTKVFSRETNSTYIINWWWNRFIWMNDDYGWGPVRAWNIHVYYTD